MTVWLVVLELPRAGVRIEVFAIKEGALNRFREIRDEYACRDVPAEDLDDEWVACADRDDTTCVHVEEAEVR